MIGPLSQSFLVVLGLVFLEPILAHRGQLEFGPYQHQLQNQPGFFHGRPHRPDIPRRSVESYLYQLERRDLIR